MRNCLPSDSHSTGDELLAEILPLRHTSLPVFTSNAISFPAMINAIPFATKNDEAVPLPGSSAAQSCFPVTESRQWACVLPADKIRPSATHGVLEDLRPVGIPGASVFHKVLPVVASMQITTSLATRIEDGTTLITCCFTKSLKSSSSSHFLKARSEGNTCPFFIPNRCRSEYGIASRPFLKRLPIQLACLSF